MLLNRADSLLVLIDVQEKLTPAILNLDLFLARCEWLLKLARKLDVPVLASEQYPKGLGRTVSPLSSYINQEECIEKIHFSCVQEPQYINLLKGYNKSQLILIGIEAHVCVLQTAIEMKGYGFDVFVVVDGVSSRSEFDLKYGLKRMKQNGIHLITAEMVLFEWLKQAGTPEFKAISKEFLQ
ncbi:TPA: isochorismatase family protein [Legionella pneumophila]|uniref:Hydrolase, isochorismatase family n=3 Tax=Legionella pneumophila TaxID=446 RepID=Q5ZX29_LEGPH|nr:isochorismatase family protein [Legionella pneumophila]ERH45248.1 isochorismatase hydrolase [Legionella pneumophila str. Leg01/53]ERH45340.1 isochorismatase hydrolase [Legionella pneumophila str. Leg01/11]ERI48548.1 isochorismatase hydrolase [Legionella pneumophila str. Leg01/20]AAU26991.1 hydrolase, isochorismatase family [Legionella pneumophila subsp. pneumophila str. Philadelphia 1]AEW51195.1 hydrolase, isochorismatase family [Legionella pneumophila subsp. pneumophila ATCC 43290]